MDIQNYSSAGLAALQEPIQLDFLSLLDSLVEEDNVLGDLVELAETIHLYLLEKSLQSLFDPRTGEETKAEILSWVLEPLVASPRKARPFSFQACCEVAGVIDIGAFREELLERCAAA